MIQRRRQATEPIAILYYSAYRLPTKLSDDDLVPAIDAANAAHSPIDGSAAPPTEYGLAGKVYAAL
jgi:hypothetical protein